MEPSTKSPQIEDFITQVFNVDRRATIESNRCVSAPIGCGQPVTGFDDELSKREYQMSGLCQDCQNRIFG